VEVMDKIQASKERWIKEALHFSPTLEFNILFPKDFVKLRMYKIYLIFYI
jgi:hypothetical protein